MPPPRTLALEISRTMERGFEQRVRAHGLALGLAANVLLLVGSSGGCGGDPTQSDRPVEAGHSGGAEPSAANPSANPSQSASPWRFVPTLEQHLPAGAMAEPVLELSQPRQRTVVILAAVLRAGAEHVELERWTFAQSPDGQSLQLVEGGVALLRLRPGTRHPELTELRRELAAPRVVLTRPLGLPVADPRALLEQLATAFATLHDAKADPRARVQAAATVVRGLDDTVAFDRDAIWEIAALLGPAPAEIEVESLAERRARAELPHAGGTATLELQRKSDGWAIAAVELPKAAPPPPSEPDPTGTTG